MSREPSHFVVSRSRPGREPGPWWRQPVYFPNEYAWLLLVATLDIVLTSVILAMGGREVNPIADRIFSASGLTGMVLFKFAAMALVVSICEYIARLRPVTARRLARFAVGISAVPVVWAMLQLFAHFYVAPMV